MVPRGLKPKQRNWAWLWESESLIIRLDQKRALLYQDKSPFWAALCSIPRCRIHRFLRSSDLECPRPYRNWRVEFGLRWSQLARLASYYCKKCYRWFRYWWLVLMISNQFYHVFRYRKQHDGGTPQPKEHSKCTHWVETSWNWWFLSNPDNLSWYEGKSNLVHVQSLLEIE